MTEKSQEFLQDTTFSFCQLPAPGILRLATAMGMDQQQ